ncbi:MAG: hypothetical protein PHE79_08640 [Eubacteriales bacterium]|nr:hypothetical protein [Eubacteriales bacterium]
MDTNETKRIIEINGIKLEVDLSTARRIDEFKVGDNIKVLQDAKNVHAGVIVDFVNFKELPTIQIAVFKQDYWGTKIDFINFNSLTDGIEIMPCSEHELKLEKCRVVDKFNVEIEKKQAEVDELTAKRDWFVKHFAKYFEPGQ